MIGRRVRYKVFELCSLLFTLFCFQFDGVNPGSLVRKRRLDVLQAVEAEMVQYGKVESWEKRKKVYHVILDSGESIYSPILGSCDVHIIGDNEVESVDKGITVISQQQVTTFSAYLIRALMVTSKRAALPQRLPSL